MLKSLLDRILQLQNAELITAGGRTYSTKPLHRVEEPTPATLEVATLAGLVDYLKGNVDGLDLSKLILHVEDHATVHVLSRLHGDFAQRSHILTARADLLQMQFNSWVDAERFDIFMQACFLPDPQTHHADILRIIGNIQQSATMNVKDDGVTQEITIKTGIARVGAESIPNPVTLRPYCTFSEVEQPASQFIFRMQEGPRCMLVEADGGTWHNVVRKSIKNYLASELAGITPHIIA